MSLLSVSHLEKSYGTFSLKDISFELLAGYIMGYVGANGAGKTTTLSCITRLIHPDGGEITIGGRRFVDDPIAYRDCIGYIGDASFFPAELTLTNVRKILALFYPSFDGAAYDQLVERWKLPRKMQIKNYSRGMKVQLMFASVLCRETKLLILDEATNGLDPVMRKDVLGLLQEYIEDGNRSVLFSTHIMEDLEDIADYIFLLDNGAKIFCEERDELLDRYCLVKGGRDEFEQKNADVLIGLETNEFGFSGLCERETAERRFAGLKRERPSVDDIVVRFLEEHRR